MDNTPDDFYNFSPEFFQDETYKKAVEDFPKDTIVFLKETGQLGFVEEVRASADGPRIKVKNIGSVPIDEIRLATSQEIENSRFRKSK